MQKMFEKVLLVTAKYDRIVPRTKKSGVTLWLGAVADRVGMYCTTRTLDVPVGTKY